MKLKKQEFLALKQGAMSVSEYGTSSSSYLATLPQR
jgi:hypothetical protein